MAASVTCEINEMRAVKYTSMNELQSLGFTLFLDFTFRIKLFGLKIMRFYIFFFVATCIGSETSHKLPN